MRDTELPLRTRLINDHPAVRVLGNTAYHYALSLLVAFWESDCRDLPPDAAALIAVARGNTASWYRVHKPVMEAVSAIIPLLRLDRERRLAKRLQAQEANRDTGRKGALIRWSRTRATRNGEKSSPVAASPAIPFQPATAPRYDNPAAATSPQALAAIDRQRAQASPAPKPQPRPRWERTAAGWQRTTEAPAAQKAPPPTGQPGAASGRLTDAR